MKVRLGKSPLALLPYLLIGSLTSAWCQGKLEGYLKDKTNDQPVIFSNLRIKGNSTVGTVSNGEGYFKLQSEEIKDSDSLLITHINYSSVIVPVGMFRSKDIPTVFLSENTIQLDEIQVLPTEDYQAFEDIFNQTKHSLHFPMTATVYYRESVRENKSFNKFADGLLTVVYEQTNDDNKIKIKVDQCRTEKLPKDDDDKFELVSPVKMEAVLGYEFGNFLNRFRKENQVNYHFYSLTEYSDKSGYLLVIEPKKEADRENDKLLYRATIKADENKIMREVQIDMDSLCHFEKSLLGLTYALVKSTVLLSFKEINGINCIASARLEFGLKFSTKKFEQSENFVSEFITIRATQEAKAIDRGDVYKKSSLYKHGSNYNSSFWDGLNLPVFTEEERKLIQELETKEKGKSGSPQQRE